MTINKQEVVIYEPSEKGVTAMRKVSFRNTGPDRYVRLSDYEEMQAEREKLRADNSELRAKLAALVEALTGAVEYLVSNTGHGLWRDTVIFQIEAALAACRQGGEP